MLTLTPRQFAILSLPDPHLFAPALASEIREAYPDAVKHLDTQQLQLEALRSYMQASEQWGVTRLRTLVDWVKAGVAWSHGALRQDLGFDLAMRKSDNASLLAEDIIHGIRVGLHWQGAL
jgi:hypothetical protein